MRQSPPRPPGLLLALLFLAPVAVLIYLLSADRDVESHPVRLVPAARDARLEVTFEHISWDPRRLAHQPPSVGLRPQFEERFEEALGPRWRVARTTADFPTFQSDASSQDGASRAAGSEDVPPPSIVALEDGGHALRFSMPLGALSTCVEVTPDTPYELAVSAACSWPDGPPSETFMAGHFGVLELGKPLDFTGLDQGDPISAIRKALPVKRPLIVAPVERAGARTRLVFKTSVYTHALLLVLVAGIPGKPLRGQVTFDDLTLTPLPLRRYLPHRTESAADDMPAPPEGQEFFPTIKMLGDLRDAFLLPPPSSMTVKVTIPGPNPILEFGYGVPEERIASFGHYPTTFSLAVIEESGTAHELFHSQVRPAGGVDELGWHDNRVDLSPWEGKEVRLRLRTDSEPGNRDMAVFGSPIIRTRPGIGVGAPSVILISLDTLRADHLGIYGYQRPTSPFMDHFFESQGQYLSDFTAAAPYTLPSHATIMTGQYPSVHGVEQFDRRLVSGIHPLLAEILAEAGYVTAGFTGGAFLGYEYGFRQGFDTYSIIDPLLSPTDPYRKRFPRMGERPFNDAVYKRYNLEHVLDFVTRHKDGPFFLFLHTYVIHNYSPRPGLAKLFDKGNQSSLGERFDLHRIDTTPERRDALTPEDLQHVINYYDACVRSADEAVRALVERLRRDGLLDETLLIVTSDHGEEFREHGGLLHGRQLYQDQLAVPFMIRVPWRPERGLIEGRGHHVDIAPTILDLLDLPVPAAMQGHSLATVLQGTPREERPMVSELNARGLGEMQSLKMGSLKLIETLSTDKALEKLRDRVSVGLELYDLQNDPGETVDLSESRASTRDRLHQLLVQWRQAMAAVRQAQDRGQDNRFSPSEATRDQLGGFGYLNGKNAGPTGRDR